MDQNPPSDSAPADELQFDRADFGETQAAGQISCKACQEEIVGAYYEINGEVACEGCRAKAVDWRTGGSASARVLWATIFGTVAGAVGAGIYYGISALTGYEFGLIAILVGFMVGFAVNFGSQQRGGWFYQLLAIALTYGSIVSTYVPTIAQELEAMEGMALEEPASATTETMELGATVVTPAPAGLFVEDSEPGTVPPADPIEPPPFEAGEPSARPSLGAPSSETAPGETAPVEAEAGEGFERVEMSSAGFWIFVIIIAFVAPFLGGFEGILGLLILGFGLWQARQLNRKQPFEVSGPFQVSNPRAAS